MSFCTQCGAVTTDSANFCAKCGAPVERDQSKADANSADVGASFFSGTLFKVIAGVLCVAGIVYAFFNGGLKTSRVPSPSEQVMMQKDWSRSFNQPAQRPQRPVDSPVNARFKAVQEQRSQ